MNRPFGTSALALAALLGSLHAQDQRPTALINARILTMTEDGTIENGTVLIRDGKIDAVGVDVRPPLGARVIDVAGGTVMPGFVHAWSSAGVEAGGRATPRPPINVQRGGRRPRGGRGPTPSGGGGGNHAATRVSDSLYAQQDVFAELLAGGVTSLFVHPSGSGFPGQAARLELDGRTREDLVADATAYTVIVAETNTNGKKLLKGEFEKAKKVLEERKKPKEQPKPPAVKPPEGEAKPDEVKKPEGEKPAEPGKEPPKPEGGEKPQPAAPATPAAAPQRRPEPKKDPNVETLADLLDGKCKSFLRLSSAMEVQHWLDGVGEVRFPTVVVADAPDARRGRLDEAIDALKKVSTSVLMAPRLLEVPWTRTLVNPAKALHDAGIEIGFVLPDDPDRLRDLRFQLMELVRCGLPADVALRAVTSTPAKMLGVEEEVGSIAVGRRADLLVFDGDPLDPTASLRHVFLRGHAIEEKASR